jgi:hypothetical protein
MKLTIPTPSVIAKPISAESIGPSPFVAASAVARSVNRSTRGDRVRKLEPISAVTTSARIVTVPSGWVVNVRRFFVAVGGPSGAAGGEYVSMP